MKFGRKSASRVEESGAVAPVEEAAAKPSGPGPHDYADVDAERDGIERLDLGSLLVEPVEGLELRLQVDEATKAVQQVLFAGSDGAVEVRPFAAARGGDLWSDIRRQIASETARRGGTATESEGRWGTELACEIQVTSTDGRVGRQQQRVIGINGPRWFLRATIVGRPAVDHEVAGPFEEVIEKLVVRRGTVAMPPGDPLPLSIPASARRAQ